MGLIRVELMTPSLSEKCSNRLSYSPNIKWEKEEKHERVEHVHRVLLPFLLERR